MLLCWVLCPFIICDGYVLVEEMCCMYIVKVPLLTKALQRISKNLAQIIKVNLVNTMPTEHNISYTVSEVLKYCQLISVWFLLL